MATIRKFRERWQAMVRRKGMAPRAKSFDSKADAERWVRNLEAEVDRRCALPDTRTAENTTLADILTRYRDEITPKKRSAVSVVARINGILRRPICYRTLALLATADVTSYRDERLKSVAPARVVRELNTIPYAIDTARREWSNHLAQNPCKLVRRPFPPRGRQHRLVGDEEQILLAAADTRESLVIVPRVSFRAYQVVEALDETARSRGRSKSLRVGRGLEFADRALDQWAHLNRVEIDLARPCG